MDRIPRASTTVPLAPRYRAVARTLAFQALCLFDAMGDNFTNHVTGFLRDELNAADLGVELHPPEIATHAREMACGAWQQRAFSDGLLRESSAEWTVERMPPVDRNIMRLALFELRARPLTPPAVVINEAVELAKRFGGADSPAFVNAVLDAIQRKLTAPEAPGAADPSGAPATGSDDGAV